MYNEHSITQQDLRAGLQVVLAVAETIREVGEAPAGHIYAALNAKGVTMEGYQSIIRTLKNTGLVKERNDVLIWTGPFKGEVAR